MPDPVTPQPEPVVPDPEPAGIVDVQGQKMVPLAALTAERDRVRTKTEEKIRAEFKPLEAKAAQADQLAADLAAVQPHIDYLVKHPEMFKEPAGPDVPTVSDEDAEKYARRYELYTANGLDLARAKQIIADNRTEMATVARQAAAEAVEPMRQTTAAQAARQNFLWAASQQTPDGAPLVDPQELATVWATFPPELAADPQVAQVILEAAIGRTIRSGKALPVAGRAPLFTEPPGGQRGGDGYRISDLERKVARNTGVSEKAWAEQAQQFKPDASNVLGD